MMTGGGTTRRGLVSGAAAVAAFSLIHRPAKAAANPFTLGVASGEPSGDGFVLWTRLAPEPLAPDGSGGLAGDIPITWEVASDEAMRNVVLRGETVAPDHFGRSVHVEVGGLMPGRPYWYRFTALGFQSPIGRAKTLDGAGAKIVFSSCAHWETGFFSAYRHMAEENPDLVVFLGDYIYEYSNLGARAANIVRPHDSTRECADLPSYRNRYALHRTDADLQRLHATAPCLAIWDDHEVQNDYGADWSQFTGTAPEAFAVRRRAAYQAFYEHMPLRRRAMPAADGSMRLFERFAFGDLVALHLVDARQYRSIQPCARAGSRRGYVAPASCADFSDATRTMLGQAQEAWLAGGLKREAARWTILAQPLMMAPLVERTPAGEPGFFTESWSGYAAARERLLQGLATVRNPVVFSGDMHAFAVNDLKRQGGDAVASEFVGAAVSSDPAPDRLLQALPTNPQVRFFDNKAHGYLRAEVSAARMAVALRKVSDRRDREATVSTLKAYVVEEGARLATEA
jgi:alkaline phosphatase D